MENTVRIQAPLPHIKSVNIWLLRGDPLTLIDTGPRTDKELIALEAGLRQERLLQDKPVDRAAGERRQHFGRTEADDRDVGRTDIVLLQ